MSLIGRRCLSLLGPDPLLDADVLVPGGRKSVPCSCPKVHFLNIKSSRGVSVHIPELRLFLNELVHQRCALLIIQHHDLHAPLPEIRLPANKVLVLANHDAFDAIEKTGSCA